MTKYQRLKHLAVSQVYISGACTFHKFATFTTLWYGIVDSNSCELGMPHMVSCKSGVHIATMLDLTMISGSVWQVAMFIFLHYPFSFQKSFWDSFHSTAQYLTGAREDQSTANCNSWAITYMHQRKAGDCVKVQSYAFFAAFCSCEVVWQLPSWVDEVVCRLLYASIEGCCLSSLLTSAATCSECSEVLLLCRHLFSPWW